MKLWEDAAMEELEISNTAGGPVLNNTVDSDTWTDGRKWYQSLGEDSISR